MPLRSKNNFRWKIDVKYGLYNHNLPDRLVGHSFVGRPTKYEDQHVVDLTKHHVPSRQILMSLQEQDPENFSRTKQILKYKSKLQKEIIGHRAEIQHLLS